MQRIVIKNFGPIKDVDIPIHDFMILIGPQASGKSTIAKAIYFFRELRAAFYDFFFSISRPDSTKISPDNVIQSFAKQVDIDFNKSWKYFPLDSFDLTFYYSDQISIQIKKGKGKTLISVLFSTDLILAIQRFLGQIPTSENNLHQELDKELKQTIINNLLQKLIRDTIGSYSDNYFIPSGRNIFSLLANKKIFDGDRIDNTIQDFDDDINDLRYHAHQLNLLEYSPEKDLHLAYNLSSKILKGSYKYETNQDFMLIKEKEINIPLDKSSSGQQEAVWPILVLLNTVNNGMPNFLIFEEPETHLYPESQKSISELIVLSVNRPNNQALITTHSPYILSAINNLLYANEVGKTHPEEVEKVVDKNLWLDYNRVMAYFVDEGKVRSIMDDELNLIKSEEIDSASQIINREYDNLSNIQYSK